MRACWVQHGAEHEWAVHVADDWREDGIETHFVATMSQGHDAYRSAGHTSTFITPLAFDERTVVSDAETVELDRMYGPPLLRSTVGSDVHLQLLFGTDERRAMAVVARAIRFWERFLDEHPIDALVLRETQSFATRSAFVVARRRDVPVLRIDIGPSDDYFTMSDVGEDQVSTELRAAIAGGPRPLTDRERAVVTELVVRRVAPRSGPSTLRDTGVPLPLLPAHLLRERIRERRARRDGDMVLAAGTRVRRWFLRRRSLARVTRRCFRYEAPPSGEYVYFPIPFRSEGMLLALHGFWMHHTAELIETIAQRLPSGCELVVKEHPAVPGDQSWRELRHLRRTPRVRVVPPTTDGLGLVQGAAAVVLLGGTAGWEAFLSRVPVVVLAVRSYYTLSELVERVDDVDQLEAAVTAAIRDGRDRYDRHNAEWEWFVHAVIASSIPGRFLRFEFPYYTDEHLHDVARGMAARIRTRVDQRAEARP